MTHIAPAVVLFLSLILPNYSFCAERFLVTGGEVRDTQTGLCWARSGNLAGTSVSWADAHAFIARLNAKRYNGHADWRLPSKAELDTLADLFLGFAPASHRAEERPAVLFARFGFKDVQDHGYWTDSFYDLSHTSYRNVVWIVSMYGGYISNINSNNRYYVWPVRDYR